MMQKLTALLLALCLCLSLTAYTYAETPDPQQSDFIASEEVWEAEPETDWETMLRLQEAADRQETLATEDCFSISEIDPRLLVVIPPKEGKNIRYQIDQAFLYARDHATDAAPYTVRVPEGDYELDGGALNIWSNTTLDCRGVTLRCASSEFNMLMTGWYDAYDGVDNYLASERCAGYGGFRNITILGGTWIGHTGNNRDPEPNKHTLIRPCHTTNLTLDGVTCIGGGAPHQIEAAAIDGLYLRNCHLGNHGDPTSRTNQDALQIDIPCSSGLYPAVYSDGTPSRNIEITDCLFENCSKGLGSHSALYGAYHTNIRIVNNTFRNIWEEAIIGMNYHNCEIAGNVMENCGTGMYLANNYRVTYGTIFDGAEPYDGTLLHDLALSIHDNTISASYSSLCDRKAGIVIQGAVIKDNAAEREGFTLPNGSYYITGVDISNNQIVSDLCGIVLSNVRSSTVKENSVTCLPPSEKDDSASKNYDGISLSSGAKSNTIQSNTVTGGNRYGIYLGNAAKTKLLSNKVKQSASTGIYVSQSAGGSKLESNSISSAGEYGIVYVGGDDLTISKNTVSSCQKDAVYLNMPEGSGIVTLSKNKLSKNNKKCGIYVKNGRFSISSNTFTALKYGIRAFTACSGTIHPNNTYSDVTVPVYVEKKIPLTAPAITSAKSTKTKTLEVKWKKLSNAAGYQFQYSTSSALSSPTSKTLKNTAASVSVSKLKSKKTYYCRIRAYTDAGGVRVYGDWSPVSKVKVK